MSSEQQKREVSRTVTTPLDDLHQDAALAVCLDPNESEIVDAGVTDDGELQLELRGERL